MATEQANEPVRSNKFRDLTALILRMLPGAHWKLPGAFLLGLLEMGIVLSIPLVTAQIINALVAGDWNNFKRYLILQALQVFAQMCVGALQQYAFLRVDETVGNNLRQLVVENVLRQRLAFFERFPVGDIVSRAVNDTMLVKGFLSGVFLQLIYDGLTIILVLGILVVMNPMLALLTAAVSPLILLFGRYAERRVEDAAMSVRMSIGSMFEGLQSWLSHPFQLKVYALEPTAAKRLTARNEHLTHTSIRLGVINSVVGVVNSTILSLPNILIFGYGGYLTLSGRLTVGELFAFVTFVAYFNAPLQRLASIKLMALPALYPVHERIVELLGPGEPNGAAAAPPAAVRSLEVSDLKFSFDGEQGYSLSVPSLVANHGEIVGVAGANGAGKSTFAKLLAGIYEPHSGETKFRGADGRELEAAERLSLFGFLPQEAALFDGTLRDNICLFDGAADAGRLSRLAERLDLAEWIGSLPDAWDTEINANLAVMLSGGQMRKIGLARLLYQKRPVLILDEPTNDLDETTRARLEEILEEARADHLILVISHSQEILARCDRVYHLRPGGESPNQITCVRAEAAAGGALTSA